MLLGRNHMSSIEYRRNNAFVFEAEHVNQLLMARRQHGHKQTTIWSQADVI